MWHSALEIAAADIARLTPNTPPAAWLPWAGYVLTAIGGLLIAAGTMAFTRSRMASAAVAATFVATSTPPRDPLGVLLIALTVLGLVTFWSRTAKSVPRWAIPVLLFAGVLFSDRGGLLIWAFAGCGLAAVEDHVSASRGAWGTPLRATAIVTLTLILIAATLPAASTSTPPAPKPLGHDRATLTSMRALLSNIPSGSYLIREDTATNILIRAAQRDFHRANVSIEPIDLDAANVRELIKMRRVFALPYAQRSLSMQGFKIVDSLRVADRGLAEVVAGADCIVATHRWQDAPQLAGHTSLAFVAASDDHRGPVVLMLSGLEETIRVNPVGWAPRTLRGFSPRSFDLHSTEGMHDFSQVITDDKLFYNTELTSNMLTRVAMWRMPDAPRLMKIELSQPAPMVGVYLSPEAKESVSVCPVFPVTVSAIR